MSEWQPDEELPENDSSLCLKTKDGYSVQLRFDECVNLWFQRTDEQQEYMHICDFPRFVELMDQLLEIGRAKFGEWK